MNPRTMIVVVLAGVCGLSAMVLVQALRKPAGGPVVPTTPAVYAVEDLKAGETISAAMIEVRHVPIDQVPEDAIRKVEDALDRAARSLLDKGDMLREKKLAEKGAGRGMAALVRPGMRAFTIQTPSFSGSLAGLILPGNHVDVLLTMTVNSGRDRDDETGGGATTTLLQDVEILAVHTTVNTPTTNKINPDDARSITLLVTPEQASLLDLGQNKGTLHISLRNLKDTGSAKTKPVSMADLQLPRTRKAPAAEPPPPTPQPPPPVVVEADPEPIEVKLTIRTLRGTSAGADVLTLLQLPGKNRTARGQSGSPAPVEPPRVPPTSAGNQARPAAAPSRATGPVG
jgi:pilus assembly protein CpaB